MNKIFNWKISLLSVISFGIITFVINLNGPLILTVFAALKEMIFRFFWGGFSGRLMQKISDRNRGIKAYILGSITPMVLAFILTFTLHYFTYTPHPYNTAVINTLFTFVSGIGTTFLFKNNLMKV